VTFHRGGSAISGELRLPSLGGPRTLREQVAHALRAALVAGEMRPGEVYSAPRLAQRLGVSATPVREALLDLAQQGLVESVRNKGFRVTVLSDRDLDEITQLRMLIEVPTVAGLAKHVSDVEIDRLRPMARRIERAAATGDLIGYVEADRQFHIELLALAGNRLIVAMASDLRARSRLYGLAGLVERGLLVESAREHTTLLNLLAIRDEEGARTLVTSHIGHVRGLWAGNDEQ
jgi:DNA-binding GntR family transcriptional regulator